MSCEIFILLMSIISPGGGGKINIIVKIDKNIIDKIILLSKKINTTIYFNTSYRTEMKLVAIIMDYCLR